MSPAKNATDLLQVSTALLFLTGSTITVIFTLSSSAVMMPGAPGTL